MPDYGSTDYWNKRYAGETSSPYDWLFDYDELRPVLDRLLSDRSRPILLIGAGNAPFSPDLYHKGGYKNLINMDISHVAMEMQAAKYPEQKWVVMDVMNMSYADKSIEQLIDKSLIDTVLCYSDSVVQTTNMIDEVYRVMAPGSRYITFSLHSPQENLSYLDNPTRYPDWSVTAIRIKSSRWNKEESRRRSAVCYTMVCCDRQPLKESHPLFIPEALSNDEYIQLQAAADEFNLDCAFKNASVNHLVSLLDRILEGSSAEQEQEAQLEADEGQGQGQGVAEAKSS